MNEKFSDAGFTNSFLDIELSYFREVLNVNLISLFSVNREFIRNNSSGVIVNISSIYGVVSPNPKLYSGSEKPISYGVSKAGVIQLSKHLATHAAPNFRVNSVVIGGVLESQGERFINAYSAGVPLGRMANPEEIVGVVKFLTTDESSYVTGSVVTVDGGWTAW
jgi:NAD(P)-dependent dehydrogenase (short-subunit alcohol dehydrogenase family)